MSDSYEYIDIENEEEENKSKSIENSQEDVKKKK